MIESLALKNFQSHKDSLIKFDPGVNVIVGSTDSGKTAFIRAIKLLVENRPSGDEYRSDWGGQTSVEITLMGGSRDGWRIIRLKDKNKNEYHKYHITSTGSHRVYKAFGTDVPEDIREILNLHEINFQYQLDSPFLLTSTPGEVAAHFNRIAGLDKIDRSVKRVNSAINEIINSNKYREKTIESYEEQLKQFDHLEQFEADVEVVEEMERKRNRLHNDITSLTAIIVEAQRLEGEISELDKIIKDRELVNNAFQTLEEIQQLEDEMEEIRQLTSHATRLQIEVNNQDDIIEDEELVNNALTLNSEIETKQAEWDELNEKVARGGALVISIAAHEDARKRYQKKFDELFPDVCPLCETPIKTD